jgi:hypothetical protein
MGIREECKCACAREIGVSILTCVSEIYEVSVCGCFVCDSQITQPDWKKVKGG